MDRSNCIKTIVDRLDGGVTDNIGYRITCLNSHESDDTFWFKVQCKAYSKKDDKLPCLTMQTIDIIDRLAARYSSNTDHFYCSRLEYIEALETWNIDITLDMYFNEI